MRIRSIKPEFFTHEGLFDLEKETGLPIRVAFAGLWCVADKAGRFKWEPRRIGVSVLPYDGVDFSRVLDALLTRGFIVSYRVNDACYGAIPSFSRHQFLNNREKDSELPEPCTTDDPDATGTREAHVNDETATRQRGREGKDRGKEEGKENARVDDAWIGLPEVLSTDAFKTKWLEYVAYRRAQRLKPLGAKSIAEQWEEMRAMGVEAAIASIKQTIRNGWQGLFPPKTDNGRPSALPPPRERTYEHKTFEECP